MPKRKPTRAQRRAGRQGSAPARPAAPAPAAARAVARPIPLAAAPGEAPQAAKELTVTRLASRDYSYVNREIVRIAVLATAVLIAIVVLSFFLP